jgi:ATP-dependent Clp protease ATP-binding subunit ClpC
MPTYRFPAMIWEDHTGAFTAALVEDEETPVSIGGTPTEALAQLKEYLDWFLHQYPWRPGPDFVEASLISLRVEVRPEYKVSNRIFPCERNLALQIPVVYGRQSNHLLICSIPTLNIRFLYHQQQRLKELVNHYVGEKLRRSTPQMLSRYFGPRNAFLEEIVVGIRPKSAYAIKRAQVDTLEAVADPVGARKPRRRLFRAWERESEVDDLVRRLTIERTNVILVGECGTGKSAVLSEAVRRIERLESEDSENEMGRSAFLYWATSGSRLIAGMEYLGEWQERCQQVIDELSDIGGALCFENLHELMQVAGGGSDAGVASFLKPYLERGELRVVAEATPVELDACRRLAPGFIELFQILQLKDLSQGQALNILGQAAKHHQSNQKISISGAVVATVYRLFRQFRPYDVFPGAALLFLDRLIEAALRERRSSVVVDHCIQEFTLQTGLPEIFLRDETPLNLDDALEEFQSRVIGQDDACHAAVGLVAALKAGVHDPNRPLGVMLFCGPTGVGKTELARTIAGYFFGRGEASDQRLIRLDMSEYSTAGAPQALMTRPDGELSEFLQRVRRQPFCVLLLDEIEKADPSVFDLLLGVLDEARLTDRFGRSVSFRSAVILITSNLGAEKADVPGFDNQNTSGFERAVMKFFRPEFFNRIDAIVQFQPLTTEVMRRITAKELREISDREGLRAKNLIIEWDPALIEQLIQTGFDPRYGARPLQRTLDSMVLAPLAKFLIERPELKNARIQLSMDSESGLKIEIL